jgi:Flp pilus assembly pilin Flp
MLTSLQELTDCILARLRATDGQTMAEYGMLLSVIAIVIVALVLLVGSEISNLFVPILHYF